MRILHLCTGLALCCALALPGGALAKKPAAASCKGSFSASLKPAEQPKGQNGQGVKLPTFNIDGTLWWASPKMRLDLTEKQSGERMRFQVDTQSGEALMLYPDTLNGSKGKLSDFDQSGYFKHFSEMLADGGVPAPEGWKREKAGSEMIGGKSCPKYVLTSPKGKTVTWWSDGKGRPVRMLAVNGGIKVEVNFSALDFGAEVPASTFTVSPDYSISAAEKKPVKPAQS